MELEYLTQLQPWQWWLAGVALLILEMLAPGTFFLWLGVSALLVGAVLWIIPDMGWQLQFIIFAIMSVSSLVLYRLYLKGNPIETDAPTLNRRGEQYIDQIFVLEEPIVNGHGKIRIGDSMWKVKGKDLERGNKVKVTGIDGIILQVEGSE